MYVCTLAFLKEPYVQSKQAHLLRGPEEVGGLVQCLLSLSGAGSEVLQELPQAPGQLSQTGRCKVAPSQHLLRLGQSQLHLLCRHLVACTHREGRLRHTFAAVTVVELLNTAYILHLSNIYLSQQFLHSI